MGGAPETLVSEASDALGRMFVAVQLASPGMAPAATCQKAVFDDVHSDAETASTAEGESGPNGCESIAWADYSDCHSNDEDMDATPTGRACSPRLCRDLGPPAAAQAGDVLTRNQLLAMASLGGPRRAGKREITCLPVALPVASLAAGAVPALAAQLVPPNANQRGLPPAADLSIMVADEERDFQRCVLAAAETLATLGEAAGPEVPPLMRELEGLVPRITKTNEMLTQALAAAPTEGSDEAKWRDVALAALQWSLEELIQKQRAAMLRLLDLAKRADAKEDDVLPSPESSVPASGGARQAIQKERPSATPPGLELPADKSSATPPGLELPADKSMTQDLESLRLHNPECVLKVRKMKKLGWDSPVLLRKHFEQFGEILQIYVTHSTMKPNPKRPGGRSRPAAVGFVVMADKEGTAAVLARGHEQLVSGVDIEVGVFDPFDARD